MAQAAVTTAVAQQQIDGQGGVDLGIPIRAVNRGTVPITWLYARVKYLLQPETPTFVPYMAMCYYQGDPRAIDRPGRPMHEQYRRNEYARLRIVHGVYENESAWEGIATVDCYPIDSDIPFNTVLRDPEGVNMGDTQRDDAEISLMRASMESMAQQLRVMQAQVAAKEQADGALSAAGIDPADLDRQATTSRALSPEEATGQSMVGQTPERRSPVAKTRPARGEGPAVTKDGE